ncbi:MULTISPECIES: hypothetical protein [unclassified Microcoleus]|uniref:hypothetical protein n=1 Tax=unclassified Microcoleus TaxID=2642155 RepID=UPI002FD29973
MKITIIKIVLVTICIFGFTVASAQTAIGKTTVDGNSILDFGTGNKGIILPWVQDASTLTGANATNGTLLYDVQTKKVRARVNGAWMDLSRNGDNTSTHTIKINAHLAKNEIANASHSGVIIGATTSSAIGVLVLESDTKALILPKMESPHLNMRNPEPGTMAYDTVMDLLCVYDGKEWSFWGI